jgi:transposase
MEQVVEKKKRAKRKKTPVHKHIELRAVRFPLEPTPEQSIKLFEHANLIAELRNMLAADRETNRTIIRQQKVDGKPLDSFITTGNQYKKIKEIVKEDARFKTVHSQPLQNVADRIEKGTQDWLKHLKEKRNGKKSPPGQVKFRKYRSFCFTQYGSAANIKNGILHLSKIGDIKINDYRKMPGKPKSITIKFNQGKWWASVSCEVPLKKLYRSDTEIANLPDEGGDPGISNLITLSDGRVFDPIKALSEALSELKTSQQDMSRKFEMRKKIHKEENTRRKATNEKPLPSLSETPYSNNLTDNIRLVGKLHTKVANVRNHHHKKTASHLEDTVRCLAVEEHGVKFMFKNRKLARAASDRAIASFKDDLRSVFGARYIPTEKSRPGIGGNSQTCLCNAQVPKELEEREHNCLNCGIHVRRDVMSANIVQSIAFGTSVIKIDQDKILPLSQAAEEYAASKAKRKEDKLRKDELKKNKKKKPKRKSKSKAKTNVKSGKKELAKAKKSKAEAGHAIRGLNDNIKQTKRCRETEVVQHSCDGELEKAVKTSGYQVSEVSKSGESQRKHQPVLPKDGETIDRELTIGAKTQVPSTHQNTDESLHFEANTLLRPNKNGRVNYGIDFVLTNVGSPLL